MAKSRKEREYGDAAAHAASHTGFERTAVKAPEGVHYFTPKKAGAYVIDIAPFEITKGSEKKGGNPHAAKGQVWYERTYYAYQGVGPENNSYIAPKTWGETKDSIGEFRRKLQDKPLGPNESKDDRKAAVGKVALKERQLFWVWDHAEPEKGWQLWDVSFHLFGKYLNEKIDGAEEKNKARWKYFFRPDSKGRTLRIVGKEKSFGGRKFLEFTQVEFKKRDEDFKLEGDLDDDGFPVLPGYLDEFLIYTPNDKLKELFYTDPDDKDDDEDDSDEDEDDLDEDESEDEEDEDEDEKPRKKSSKKSKKDDDEEEDDEDDEDEDLDEDEDDEDEKPAKKPVKKSSKKDDDDEDEDEDDEEDEDEDEDDRPAKKKKPSKKSSKDEDDDEEEDEEDDIPFDDDEEDEDEDRPRKKKK